MRHDLWQSSDVEVCAVIGKDLTSHLERVIDVLAARFRGLDRAHVAEVVHQVYDELNAHATVRDHLPALTQHHAQERLRAELAAV